MEQAQNMGDARRGSYRTFVRGVAVVAGLTLGPVGALAQLAPPHRPIRFVRSDVETFLPQSSVYDILQDRSGFLWFATREGIGRWDGYEMRTWKTNPFADDALPDNVVRHFVEDGQGSVWAVVLPDNFESSRLARLVGPNHDRVQTLPILDALPVVDVEGVAWAVGRDSIFRFDSATASLRAIRPRLSPGRLAGGAHFDRAGLLWVATPDGVLERYDFSRQTGQAIPYPRSDPARGRYQRFLEDRSGTLWLTGWGLHRLDSARTALERVSGLPVALDSAGTAAILQDPDGWIWVATTDGVYRFDPARTRVERYSLELPGGITSQNFVVGLLRDRAGAIWAGTVWGLHRYDPAEPPFGFLGHDPDNPHTLSGGVILPLLEDDTGTLWVGSLGGGVNRLDAVTGRVSRYRASPGAPSGLPHDWVWGLADAGGGRAWVGTEEGLALVDPSAVPAVRRIAVSLPGPAPSRSIYALLPDSAGGLWIGTSGWLVYREPGGRTIPSALPFIGTIHTLRRDGAAIWVGSSVGLIRFEPATGRRSWYRHDPRDSTSLSHDVVLTLHLDRGGHLWVGTNAGLNRLARNAARFEHMDGDGALRSAAVYSILEDDQSRLWLGTNRGIVRFDPSARAEQPLRRYDASSGTVNVEFNRGSGLRGRDGTFYFGGDRGLTVFHPEEMGDNPYIPPVVLTSVQRARRDGVDIRRHVAEGAPVVLAPDDYTVTFTFAALSYTLPPRNQYAYRMDGFDPQWIPAGTSRTASYTNLPPGRYTFRVRGSNDAGVWNDVGLAVPVVVQPAFWETIWFRALLGAGLLGLVSVGTAMAQRSRHRQELAELQYRRALEAERARISRDMHDEVGAGLTELAMLGEVAMRAGPGADGERAAAGRMADRARAMLGALGEIIWAINPDHDQVDRVTSYLREYAADFLDGAGLEATLHFEPAGWVGPVSAEARRNLLLVLKEALTNAARHAGASRVSVELTARGGRLQLRVSDDGRGLDPAAVASAAERGHLGLPNLTRRAAALGGTLEIGPAPGGGTCVALAVPLTAKGTMALSGGSA